MPILLAFTPQPRHMVRDTARGVARYHAGEAEREGTTMETDREFGLVAKVMTREQARGMMTDMAKTKA